MEAIGYGGGNNGFNLSRDLARPRDSRTMRLFRWEHFKLKNQLARFGGHRHCGNADIVVVVSFSRSFARPRY